MWVRRYDRSHTDWQPLTSPCDTARLSPNRTLCPFDGRAAAPWCRSPLPHRDTDRHILTGPLAALNAAPMILLSHTCVRDAPGDLKRGGFPGKDPGFLVRRAGAIGTRRTPQKGPFFQLVASAAVDAAPGGEAQGSQPSAPQDRQLAGRLPWGYHHFLLRVSFAESHGPHDPPAHSMRQFRAPQMRTPPTGS